MFDLPFIIRSNTSIYYRKSSPHKNPSIRSIVNGRWKALSAAILFVSLISLRVHGFGKQRLQKPRATLGGGVFVLTPSSPSVHHRRRSLLKNRYSEVARRAVTHDRALTNVQLSTMRLNSCLTPPSSLLSSDYVSSPPLLQPRLR